MVCSTCPSNSCYTPSSTMMEQGMQGQSAIQSSQQQPDPQQQLSVNQQAQRWTVQMYAGKLGLPASARPAQRFKDIGAKAAKIWSRERGQIRLERGSTGILYQVWHEEGCNKPSRAECVPEMEGHLFAEARMKYSLAYKGAWEASDVNNFDAWTYPAGVGAEVLQEAFHRVAVTAKQWHTSSQQQKMGCCWILVKPALLLCSWTGCRA